MTAPVFTPTPVIGGTGAADMPDALGTRIGVTTDQNFVKTDDWSSDLEVELAVSKYTGTQVATPAANFGLGTALAQFFRGSVCTLYINALRTGGTALVSNAVGTISSTTICTLLYPPPYSLFFPLRCYRAPMLNCYINASGALILRGCSALSYTFPTTWTVEGEVMWIGG